MQAAGGSALLEKDRKEEKEIEVDSEGQRRNDVGGDDDGSANR